MMAIILSSIDGIALDYTITGKIANLDGKTIYLYDYDTRQKIDSAIISNGSFSIKGSYYRPAYVRVESGREYSNCILEPQNVVVDFTTHQPLSGGELNNKLIEFNQSEEKIYNRLDALRDSIGKLPVAESEKPDIFQKISRGIISAFNDGLLETIIMNQNGLGEVAMMSYGSDMSVTSQQWNELYARLPDYHKERKLTKRFNERYANRAKSEVGKPFINFKAKSLDGKDVELSDYVGKGKYILVDFWASWCAPCRKEAAEVLTPLYERYGKHKDFEILGVQVWEDSERMTEYLAKHPSPWPQIIGAGKKPMKLYGFDFIPMIILFGPDGTILSRDLRGDRLVSTVESYLNK